MGRKIAVIVGGTGQVGSVCAATLAQNGFRVFSLSRHPSVDSGPEVEWHSCDVLDSEAFRSLLNEIAVASGTFDALVYTPALNPDVDIPLAEYSLERWHANWNVYVTGFLVAFQESLKLMRGGGHVVALGSAVTRFTWDHLPPFFAGHYAVTKAALNELIKWSKREAHANGILLSRIAPGALDVPFHRNAPDHRRPKKVIPVPQVVEQIVVALLNSTELDLEIVETIGD